jgi:hypothetical protein
MFPVQMSNWLAWNLPPRSGMRGEDPISGFNITSLQASDPFIPGLGPRCLSPRLWQVSSLVSTPLFHPSCLLLKTMLPTAAEWSAYNLKQSSLLLKAFQQHWDERPSSHQPTPISLPASHLSFPCTSGPSATLIFLFLRVSSLLLPDFCTHHSCYLESSGPHSLY